MESLIYPDDSSVNIVINLLLKNPRLLRDEREHWLIKKIAKVLNISRNDAFLCLNAAKDEIRIISSPNHDDALKRALLDREYLISLAKGVKDSSGKVILSRNLDLLKEVIIDRDKLLGLYVESSKSETLIKKIDLSHFTDEGLRLIAEGKEILSIMTNPLFYKQVNSR